MPRDIGTKPRQALEEFAASDRASGRAAPRAGRCPRFIDEVLGTSGYREALKAERSPRREARLENLEELIAAAEEFIASQRTSG